MAERSLITQTDPKQEEWRPVVGYERFYEISSLGRIRSLDRVAKYRCPCGHGFVSRLRKGRVLRPCRGSPYPTVALTRSDGRGARTLQVHALVCEAFHGPRPSSDHEVAHGDGNPKNAQARNVRWATSKENKADKLLHGTHQRGEDIASAKITDAQVQEMRRRVDASNEELAGQYGISVLRVGKIMAGSERRVPSLSWSGLWLDRSKRKPYGGLDALDKEYILAHPELAARALAEQFRVSTTRIYKFRSNYRKRASAVI